MNETNSSAASATTPLFGRLKCFFGAHDWETVSVGFDGISHLKECTRCGRGTFLQFLGYASTVGKVSREEMQKWHQEARGPNAKAMAGNPAPTQPDITKDQPAG